MSMKSSRFKSQSSYELQTINSRNRSNFTLGYYVGFDAWFLKVVTGGQC